MTKANPIHPLLRDLVVTVQPVSNLTPYTRNARTHSKK